MTDVKVLIFDDESVELKELGFSLSQAWIKYRWPNGDSLPKLVITSIDNKADLQQCISSGRLNERFDFFLCDIYVGAAPGGAVSSDQRRPEPEGFRFLKMAKQHGMPLCFAITTGQWGPHESYQKAHNEFAKYLDESFLKGDLGGVHKDSGPYEVLRKIATLLRNKGLIKNLDSALAYDGPIQEARTLGIVEEVGEANINALASSVAYKGVSSFKLSSLSPGLSGAKIVKLTFEGSSEDFSTRPILLKISRDRNSLLRELANYQAHLLEPGRHSLMRSVAQPRNIELSPFESTGWYAISFECAAPAISLVDWLTQSTPPDTSNVYSLLSELFLDGGLTDMYSTTMVEGTYVLDSVEVGLLSKYRKMAIMEAIDEFRPLIKNHLGGEFSELSELSLFLEHGRLDGVETRDLQKRMTKSCLVHGDFHGRNVLVVSRVSRESAFIIDIASMRTATWTVDLVRLICDIFLSGWDRGSQSLEWSELESWAATLPLIVRHQNSSTLPQPSPQNVPIKAAVDWLFENKLRIAGLTPHSYLEAEFSLSLAIEFARAAYRDRDMTAPKRAFSLVIANALLKEAIALFNLRGRTI